MSVYLLCFANLASSLIDHANIWTTNTQCLAGMHSFVSCSDGLSSWPLWHRVVGGMEVLSAMEAVETDKEDRPCEEIKICTTSVFVDPFKEAEEEV